MKKIILLTLIFLASSQFAFSQQAIAKIKYEEAEEAFSTNDFKTTILKLDEAETLLKATNPRIMYLKILAQSKIIEKAPLNDYKILENTRQLCAKYLLEYESIPNNEDKYRDVYKASEALKAYPESKEKFQLLDTMRANGLKYLYEKEFKDYAKALDCFTELAKLGDITAKAELGRMYYNGFGVTQDYKKAFVFFKEAAENGNAVGQNGLGLYYFDNKLINGLDIAIDHSKAIKLFELAAEQGNDKAIFNLGRVYYSSKQFNDYSKALNYFSMAAKKGNTNADNYIGIIYLNGLGVTANANEALLHFKLAASAENNQLSQYNIGMMYYMGCGVKKDDIEAVKYFLLATDHQENGGAGFDYQLGIMYLKGFGVPKDKNKADILFQKAAISNVGETEYNLEIERWKKLLIINKK